MSSAPAAEPQKAATATLVERLQSEDGGARFDAAVRLLEMGDTAHEVYPALVQALIEDERLDCRLAAQVLYANPARFGETAGVQMKSVHLVPGQDLPDNFLGGCFVSVRTVGAALMEPPAALPFAPC